MDRKSAEQNQMAYRRRLAEAGKLVLLKPRRHQTPEAPAISELEAELRDLMDATPPEPGPGLLQEKFVEQPPVERGVPFVSESGPDKSEQTLAEHKRAPQTKPQQPQQLQKPQGRFSGGRAE